MKTLDRVKTGRWLLTGALAGLLAACGGGDSIVASDTLGGVAAVGAPIVSGTIDVVCAGGSNLSTTTGSAGAWQVTMSGQTLPCAVRVSGGTINGAANSTPYHSAALSFGTLNVTPLTDLVMANMLGATPTSWFSGLGASARPTVTQADLDAARTRVVTALGMTSTLNGGNPLTAAFTPSAGNLYDDALRAMTAAMTSAGVNYASLLTTVYNTNFTAPAGFSFSSAYAGIAPAAGGGGGGACASGATSMTFGSAGTGSPYTNGTVVCFTASTTSLAFSGKTLTSPTQNTAVSAPASAYIFTDGAYKYEVAFISGALHEINVMGSGTTFYGQFAPTPAASGGLVVTVSISGIAAQSINVGNVPAPSSQADFCNSMSSNSTFTSIQSGAGGSFTINNCSFSGKVGTVNATLAITTPVQMTVPYVITYTYP